MRALPALALCLAGCTSFPDVEAAIPPGSARGAPPALLPLGTALASVPPVDPDRDAGIAATSAGADALRARAATLEAQSPADMSDRLARLRERAAILSRSAPDADAVDAIAADLDALR